jgi:azurin
MSLEESVIGDHWLAKAVYASATQHNKGFLDAFLKEHPDFLNNRKVPAKREVPDWDDTSWKEMELPQRIEQAGLNIDGIIWFRTSIDVPSGSAGKKATLSLGPVDDSDVTWVNGVQIGTTLKMNNEKRVYSIPSNVLKAGKNVVAVRVEDNGGGGGIHGNANDMFVEIGGKKLSLSGKWKFEVEKEFNSKNLIEFQEASIAEVFADAHLNKKKPDEGNASVTATGEATIIKLGVIKNEMKYDLKTFSVEAGKPVEIIFENPDFMQHNLVIAQAGALDKVGQAADKLASDPKGAEMHYVPKIPEVLFATKLVNPQETVKLNFIAPEKEGDYPFVCTFPGHWSIMNGTMKVVAKKAPL